MTHPHRPDPETPPAARPRGRARTALRWTVRVLGAVVALLLVGAGVVYALSERRLKAQFSPPEHALEVRGDAATVERGRYLATTRGCTDCHGASFGGNILIDDPAIGRLAGPNLTRGGRGAELSDREWELAVRHGLRADGSALVVMPSQEFTGMSDDDLAAIIAYARSVPAVDTTLPATRPGPVPRVMHLAGQMQLMAAEVVDHRAGHTRSVAVAPTVEYGAYVAAGCTGCHGPGFSGGKIPGAPPGWDPAANITPAGIGAWSEADFVRAMRTGLRPDGSRISDRTMPLKMIGAMDEVELQAIYRYLRTVPAKAYGGR